MMQYVLLVVAWSVGVAAGYYLAWRRFNHAFLLIDKERLRTSNRVVTGRTPS